MTRLARQLTLGLAVIGGSLVAVAGAYVMLIAIDASIDGRPFHMYRNVTGAMAPALQTGDRFTVLSLRGVKGELLPVSRGDLVAHRWPPDTSKVFIKRIVGLPRDTLGMVNGVLFLNGRKLAEPYAWHEEPTADPASDDFNWQRQYLVGAISRDTAAYHASRNNWGPIALPADSYFVLGDNRDNSLDSRYWGVLPGDDIVSQARRVYFSRDPSTGEVRWGRFGKRLR